MKIEIQGRDAVSAAEELLRIEGLSGSHETFNEGVIIARLLSAAIW